MFQCSPQLRKEVLLEPEAARLFSRGLEHALRYFDCPKHMWVSSDTNNPVEQLIGKLRQWTGRFNYFRGYTNLEPAIFTLLAYKGGELVPGSVQEAEKIRR